MVLILYQFGGFLSIDARNGYRYSSYYEKVGKNEVCIDDEIPFELPDGWAWTRLSAVCEMYTGDSINETEKKKKYMGHTDGRFYIGTKDVGFDHVITYDNGVRIPYEEESKFRIAPSLSTLLCVEGGSAGRKIAMLNQAVCFGNKLCCFVPHSIDETYLYYYLQSPSFISVFKSNTTGIIGGVSINTLKGLLFAIPPLSEQHRIVQKLLLLSPYIAEYNEYEQAESLLNEELPTMIRKSILQYAIQGKLVPQDPSDEPASVLLERIRNEREKANGGKKSKAKTESYIFKNSDDNSYYENYEKIDDLLPFEIPDTWRWCRLGELIDFSKNKSVSASDIAPDAWILDLEDIEKDSGKILVKKRKKDLTVKSDKHEFNVGNVLYSKLRPYLNKVVIADEQGYCTSEILAFDFGEILAEYAQIYLMSPYFVDYAMSDAYGVKMPRVGSAQGNAAFMPIPPIKEQERIVSAVKEAINSIAALA